MARYLRTHGVASGDYTRDRHMWLDKLTIENILEEARKLEQNQGV
jgi:hypothetical protein